MFYSCKIVVWRMNSPNFAFEWAELLLLIREETDWNPDSETGHPDWGFRGFLQFLQANTGIMSHIRPRQFAYIFSLIHYSLNMLPFDVM
jgi:hypothetical protein